MAQNIYQLFSLCLDDTIAGPGLSLVVGRVWIDRRLTQGTSRLSYPDAGPGTQKSTKDRRHRQVRGRLESKEVGLRTGKRLIQ